jgi:hypothetical protein
MPKKKIHPDVAMEGSSKMVKRDEAAAKRRAAKKAAEKKEAEEQANIPDDSDSDDQIEDEVDGKKIVYDRFLLYDLCVKIVPGKIYNPILEVKTNLVE